MQNVVWLSLDMQACIDPPPIPIMNLEVDDDRTTHIMKVKMRGNTSSVSSETYNVNMKKWLIHHHFCGSLLLLRCLLRWVWVLTAIY